MLYKNRKLGNGFNEHCAFVIGHEGTILYLLDCQNVYTQYHNSLKLSCEAQA